MEKSIVLNKLASVQGRRDEIPNIEFAKEIAIDENLTALQIIINEIFITKNSKIQNDCIKVVYELGELKPAMLTPYFQDFLKLLSHKNNRLQWGGMLALYYVSVSQPKLIYSAIPKIVETAEKGSVITKDGAVNILIEMAKTETYKDDMLSLLKELMLKSPTNQLPMYAERAYPVIDEKNKKQFAEMLQVRLNEIEKESKKKRVEKIINKLMK